MTMNDLVLLGKALADPTRVRIVYALLHSDLCVCEMVDCLELGQSTLSNHLQTIRQAGIVQTTRRHKMVNYAVTEEAKTLLQPLFQANLPALQNDKRLTRDLERIDQRLKFRTNGICDLGPGQLDKPDPIREFIDQKNL